MFRFVLSLLFCAARCVAQTSALPGESPQLTAPSPSNAPEVTTQEEPFIFKSKVTLIQVPVVVRARSGQTVGTLRQENFQLFDKGKPQVILKFSVEKSGGKAIARLATPEAVPSQGQAGTHETAPVFIAPDHFVALAFDDIHMEFPDLSMSRTAAEKFIASSLTPADRIAIFTTSGQTTLDFTSDRNLLRQTLLKLAPHPMDAPPDCLPMTYAEGYRIADLGDPALLHNKALQALGRPCISGGLSAGETLALSRAGTVLNFAEYNARHTFAALGAVVRRMSQMPGQRTLVLASPGFIRPSSLSQEEGRMIDLAIQAGVIINALDVRGLYVAGDTADAAHFVDRKSAMLQSDILEKLAIGTGGRLIENTNDLATGFAQLGAAPEVYYLLGFSPSNLKLDGALHSLKVSVTAPGLSVQARRGYYAPVRLSSADDEAKNDISKALFSRAEIRNIPIELNTRFLKSNESKAKLTILSRVDVRTLHFRKAGGRNVNDVLLVYGLFDRDGNYLQGVTKTVQMRLLDDTLQNKLNNGISVRADFDVTPGTYVVRVVVRDAEGQRMAAQNGAVDIPVSIP